jgi:hypothetical protein
MHRAQEGDAPVVGDDDALEPPLLAQDLGQQTGVGGRRKPVDLAVGVHHRARAALAHGHLERRQEHVAPDARAGGNRSVVAAGLGTRVPGEVLQRGDDADGFEAAHVGRAHHADEIRVLAERLLDASPAVIAHDVQHR